MGANLEIYLQDHLAGARFATELLADLETQDVSTDTADLAHLLLIEIKEDREHLETLVSKLGTGPSPLKEVSAWIAQKTGRLKFELSDRFGVFEAIEFMSLGVLGKRALWAALQALPLKRVDLAGLDLPMLLDRANTQHELLEGLRLKLAGEALSAS